MIKDSYLPPVRYLVSQSSRKLKYLQELGE